jgi:hypothetical protein
LIINQPVNPENIDNSGNIPALAFDFERNRLPASAVFLLPK